MASRLNGSRLEAVQVMRGLAAMLVVVVHSINSNDFRTDLPRSWLGAGHFNEFGASGVDLFFVLSGFVMAHAISNPSASSPWRFMVNRLIRIVPYFWAASLLFLALTTATGRTYHAAALFNNLTIFPLYNPMTFDPPALLVGWSLAFELAFYAVVSFSIWIAPMPSARLRIVAQIVALLAVTGFILQPNMDLLAIWANPIWLEFLLGIAVYQLWKLPSMFVPSTACWLLIVVGTVGLSQSILFGFPFQTPHWGILNENAGFLRSIWWATPYAILLLGLLWLSEISRSLSKSGLWDFLRRVGDASYSLYLVHLMVIFAWEDLAPTNTINPDLVILVLLAVNVLLALLCYRWFEAPMLRTLRQKILGARARLAVQVPA